MRCKCETVAPRYQVDNVLDVAGPLLPRQADPGRVLAAPPGEVRAARPAPARGPAHGPAPGQRRAARRARPRPRQERA